MAWQYSHYHPQTAYPTLYSDQYAGQTYQQAWYNYYQQQARAAAAAQQAGTSTGTAVPATTTVPQVTTVAPIQTAPATTTTFSTYNPTFVRDSAATGSGSGTGGRGPRRQSQLKGLFSKECEQILDAFHIAHLFLIYPVELLYFSFSLVLAVPGTNSRCSGVPAPENHPIYFERRHLRCKASHT